MKYSVLYHEIVKVLSADGEQNYYVDTEMSGSVSLWESMYQNQPVWVDNKKTFGANLPASIASEFARLTTFEMRSDVSGSAMASYLNDIYQKDIISSLRRFSEYGLAKGSLVIKPVPTASGLRTQFIQAGSFFPICFDGSGNITKCVFAEQQRRGKYVYTLLEIHTISGGILTVENRAFRSANETLIGTGISLSEVENWKDLCPKASFKGIDSLDFGLFCCPMANQINCTSPLGVSVYSRSPELIREADRRYSLICWEYEAKEAAVHISESMLKFNKEQGKYEAPEGRDRLYRTLEFNTGATDKPLIDIYSPEIRSSSLYEGWNNQLRLIEFNCSLAYGTLSDPNNVDKTATEVLASKQRSYTFVCDIQRSFEKALDGWAKAAAFWAQIYGFAPGGSYKSTFEWGDSILSDPDAERENDRKDLANGTFRPEEYRAKYRNETVEEALENLPKSAEVIE